MPIADLDDATAAAVQSIEGTTEQVYNARNSYGVEFIYKVKLWNKNTALGQLAKNLAHHAQDTATEAAEK